MFVLDASSGIVERAADVFYPDGRARLVLMHAFGIFLCEQRFGTVLTRVSDGASVPTRPVAEAYVLRVFRGRIPTASGLLEKLPLEPWMGARARPLSKELGMRS